MMMSDAGRALTAAVPPKRRLRRVADTSRKRTVQSCDFCRKRRCKCVSQASSSGCLMCQSQGVECSYTLPRKTRFYGSVDDLSDRFKCLEAIVRGAFPGDSISTVPDLLHLGERMGYAMPDLSKNGADRVSLEYLVSSAASATVQHTTDGNGATVGDRVDAEIEAPNESAAWGGERNSVTATEKEKDAEDGRRDDATNSGNFSNRNNPSGGAEGESLGLIFDTTGQEHFIGPSGSLQFLGQLRRLLLISKNENRNSQRVTATLIEEDAAQALETDCNFNGEGADPVAASGAGPPSALIDGPSPSSINSALAKDYVTIQPDDVDAILSQLPPRHITDALVRTYFKHVHPDFPLFHRGTFEEEYEQYLSSSRRTIHHYVHRSAQRMAGRSLSADPGWLACLHMILAFASFISPSTGIVGAGLAQDSAHSDIDLPGLRRHCIALTRYRLLPHFISRCTLSNIRALLLLSLYLHNHNERNAAWNIVGTATRASFAMGLHRTFGETHFRPVERETRRRVFCTLFGFEQFLASSLGRPSGLPNYRDLKLGGPCENEFGETEIEIIPPRTELLDGGYGRADDDEDDAISRSYLRLQILLARARVSPAVKSAGPLTGETDPDREAKEKLLQQENSARDIIRLLDAWRKDLTTYRFLNLPVITEQTDSGNCDILSEGQSTEIPTMDFQELKVRLSWQSRTRLRAAIMLHVQYRYVAILSTRSSLLNAMASAPGKTQSGPLEPSFGPSDNPKSMPDICVHNAVQLCRLILLADAFDLINGTSALDIFYAYCGGMVLILRSLGSPNPHNATAVTPIQAAATAQVTTSSTSTLECVTPNDPSMSTSSGVSSLCKERPSDKRRESTYRSELRSLIARTREVLMRVDKCSTMKRFSRVVATFEEGSKQIISVASSDEVHDTSHNSQQDVPTTTAEKTVLRDLPAATANQSQPIGVQVPNQSIATSFTTSDASTATAVGRSSPMARAQEQQGLQLNHTLNPLTVSPSFAHRISSSNGNHRRNRHLNNGTSQQNGHVFTSHETTSMSPFLGMPESSFWQQPNLLTLFDGEPEENQWVMDTFLDMAGGLDGSLPVLDWGSIDSMMRNPGP